jgi:hypothetical protein
LNKVLNESNPFCFNAPAGVPLAPLVGAVLAGVFGTTFGGNWIGRA